MLKGTLAIGVYVAAVQITPKRRSTQSIQFRVNARAFVSGTNNYNYTNNKYENQALSGRTQPNAE